MSAIDSPFYPPRAGWWSRRLTGWHRLRRKMESTRFTPDGAPSRGRLLVWLLVPGAVYFSKARDLHGVVCGAFLLLGWLTAIAIHFVWIGLPAARLAYILLPSAVSISATVALQVRRTGRPRAALGGCVVALACAFAFHRLVSDRIVRPIEGRGANVLINMLRSTASVQRGEWVAYERGGGVGFERVLALPGDTVRFHPDKVVVAEVAYERASKFMPERGEWVVPRDSYLVWPQGFTAQWARTFGVEGLIEYSLVKRGEIVGPAYRRWLWRKPVLEPLVVLKTSTLPSPGP